MEVKIKHYTYFCNHCNYQWESIVKIHDPVCPSCKQNEIIELPEMEFKEILLYDFPDYSQDEKYYQSDPCLYCTTNPKNGGSGICHCTLPNRNIIC